MKMYQEQGRPGSINKGVIGGSNFQQLDTVELVNFNNKQRVFNSTMQQFAQILPEKVTTNVVAKD